MKIMNQSWVKLHLSAKVDVLLNTSILVHLCFYLDHKLADKPLKDISHLMNEPQKFALIKLDKVRGNACVSRREIISSFKKEDKAKDYRKI